MIVAVDGPAGAGKSTVARLVAERIAAGYLNTGAMYRAVALLAARANVPADDEAALAALAAGHEIRLEPIAGGERVLIDGSDVSGDIRLPAVTAAVSAVAAHPEVRAVVVAQQRDILRHGDWVADGRDIGTAVAPGAEVKVFLTADAAERARRRHAELAAGGDDVVLGDVLQDIVTRDAADSSRATSPLMVAPGAHVIDTSDLEIDEVVDRVVDLVERRRGNA